PPVAVGLGRLVGGERERIARFHKHHVVDVVHDSELIGGGNARDAGATDDDLRRCAHAASSAARSIASMSASDIPKWWPISCTSTWVMISPSVSSCSAQ